MKKLFEIRFQFHFISNTPYFLAQKKTKIYVISFALLIIGQHVWMDGKKQGQYQGIFFPHEHIYLCKNLKAFSLRQFNFSLRYET